ncbi:hypothetical protein WPS_01090 [Vulcanimicrobium alpinum]|uniref:Coenzyme Q-binding protein COQ10 START domain-containing protein n=1 Tax=Vulcanimicrobium alpinum TaxID=3016050 RepID=A0AAN1XRY4_UNVUL|nr:SRPBCC family protein [Vulcanimicrobium alpinum]BDE04833.1 hypothetical protein WPS_01090 [Vulcanimicrobium alpinum]
MAQHTAAVSMNAPAAKLYALFARVEELPKLMTFVKDVRRVDDRRTHWVVDAIGRTEFDAVDDGSIPDRRLAWRAVDGTSHRGQVTFEALAPRRTHVAVRIEYHLRGAAGALSEAIGGETFAARLQRDLEHVARLVDAAPENALDRMSATYLFRDEREAPPVPGTSSTTGADEFR